MSKRQQFSLKALFVIIAVLAVPMWMVASGDDTLVVFGLLLAFPVLYWCVGYLIGVR